MSHWIIELAKSAAKPRESGNSLFEGFMRGTVKGNLDPLESFPIHMFVEDFMEEVANSQENSQVKLQALDLFKAVLFEHSVSAKRVAEDCDAGIDDLTTAQSSPEVVG